MAMDQVPDVMRSVGISVLSCSAAVVAVHDDHKNDDDDDDVTYKATLRMLKHMFARHPKHVSIKLVNCVHAKYPHI